MKRKNTIWAMLLGAVLCTVTPAIADFGEEFQEQEARFFGQLSDTFNVDFAKRCEAFQELPEDADTRWVAETHLASAQGRSPSYLEELHCIMFNKSRAYLTKYKMRHQQSEVEQIAFNIRSLVMLHGFHSALFDKIYDLNRRGLKEFLGREGVLHERIMGDFGYLSMSATVAAKLGKHFSDRYPPNRVILANVRAMKLYQNEDTFNDLMLEATLKYPHEDDAVLVGNAIGRIAERRVLIQFIRKMNLIYSRINTTIHKKTEFQGKDQLKIKDTMFHERFVRAISKMRATHMNSSDPNVDRFLMALFSLKAIN